MCEITSLHRMRVYLSARCVRSSRCHAKSRCILYMAIMLMCYYAGVYIYIYGILACALTQATRLSRENQYFIKALLKGNASDHGLHLIWRIHIRQTMSKRYGICIEVQEIRYIIYKWVHRVYTT